MLALKSTMRFEEASMRGSTVAIRLNKAWNSQQLFSSHLILRRGVKKRAQINRERCKL
jgi:hypothetical protein